MLPPAFLKNKKAKKAVKSAMVAKKAFGGKRAKPKGKTAKGNPFAERMTALKMKGKFGKEASY
jgi:hypothetical protein